jgi:hypothetical protein
MCVKVLAIVEVKNPENYPQIIETPSVNDSVGEFDFYA